MQFQTIIRCVIILFVLIFGFGILYIIGIIKSYIVLLFVCIYIVFSLLFTNLVLNQGPMEDHLSVNGLPCINIRNK